MSAMKGDEHVARLVIGYHSLSVEHRNKGAVIYHALQDGTNAPAALKVLRIEEPIAAPTDDVLATMLRLSAHPHIVSILATGVTTTGRPCVAMQYCPEGSYADILAARGPLPVGRVVETGLMIASALVAAHAEGLLHRAVTPSNILQTQAGPALSDFPISRPPEDLSGTLGTSTSHHAAPEVLLEGAHSPASDVYGLASTLWTLLAGHPPFARPGDAELDFFTYRDRALADPAPPVAIDAVPARLQAVLDKALSKNPALRYRSAEDFGTALSTVETQTSSPPRRHRRRSTRGQTRSVPRRAPPTRSPSCSTWSSKKSPSQNGHPDTHPHSRLKTTPPHRSRWPPPTPSQVRGTWSNKV